jgi:NADPH-dependent FMN reductase
MSTQTTQTVAARRIVGLAGSLRAGSVNRRLLAAVAYQLPADVTLEVWDGLEGVPPFNEDLERGPAPVAVAELRSVIKHADGVLIATPEYNGSIPGQLKNALDWASRPRGAAVLQGKPAATLSASPSRRGGGGGTGGPAKGSWFRPTGWRTFTGGTNLCCITPPPPRTLETERVPAQPSAGSALGGGLSFRAGVDGWEDELGEEARVVAEDVDADDPGSGYGEPAQPERAVYPVIVSEVGGRRGLSIGEGGEHPQSPTDPTACASRRRQVARPENQVLVPTISIAASARNARSSAAVSAFSKPEMYWSSSA